MIRIVIRPFNHTSIINNSTLTDAVSADFDDHDEFDEETEQRLQKEIDEAEEKEYPSGKPGSFLNRLIAHGNKKTEDQLKQESLAGGSQASA